MPAKKAPIGERYREFFALISPITLYTPATLATHAIENTLVVMEADLRRMRGRLRTTFSRLSHGFAESTMGDGTLNLPGQAPMVAYFGWRWQQAVGSTLTLGLEEAQAEVAEAQVRWDQKHAEKRPRAQALEATCPALGKDDLGLTDGDVSERSLIIPPVPAQGRYALLPYQRTGTFFIV